MSLPPEGRTERLEPILPFAAPAQGRPGRPRQRSIPRALNTALWWSELAFLATAALGLLIAVLENALGGLGLSFATVMRLGGLYFFGFNHVRMDATVTSADVEGPLFGLSVAMLTGTAVAVALTFVGGRGAGRAAGGRAATRALWGSLVALPYAAFSLVLSFAVGIGFGLPRAFEGGGVNIAVAHLQAFLWPLAIAGVAGAVGGLWSAREDRTEPTLLDAVLRGGWRMLAWGLGLSMVGILVLAGVRPDATRDYLDRTAGGGARGVALLLHHLLVLPNQSAAVLVPAMGACDRLTGVGEPSTVLCYARFPVGGDLGTALLDLTGIVPTAVESPLDAIEFAPAPRGFLVFLLVPAAATVLGGFAAGSGMARASLAVRAGALAGVGFALAVGLISALAGISLHVGAQQPTTATLGPDPVLGALVGLAWGVGGGAIGGLLSRVRRQFGRRTP